MQAFVHCFFDLYDSQNISQNNRFLRQLSTPQNKPRRTEVLVSNSKVSDLDFKC